MDFERQLIDFISSEIAYERGSPIGSEEPLLDGVLDSTDVLRLTVFIEERFGVEVTNDELVPENFENVARLDDFLRRKTAAPPS